MLELIFQDRFFSVDDCLWKALGSRDSVSIIFNKADLRLGWFGLT